MKPLVLDESERGGWTSASNAEADLACPGRHLAQRGLPDTESLEAESGRRIHAALAREPGAAARLDLAEADIYASCSIIEARVLEQYFGKEYLAGNCHREQRLWMNCGPFKHSGKPDVFYVQGKRGLVIDYKTGSGDVAESPRNLQLRDLAVLVWVNHKRAFELATAIIQPLVTHSPEICVYTAGELARAEMEMVARIKASNNPNSPRIAGEVQCKYCKAKSSCGQYQRWASADLPVPASLVDVPLAQWKPEQRTRFCDQYNVAKKWLEGCWDELERLETAQPGSIPGYGMVDGSVRETITDAQSVFSRFIGLGGNLAAFMQCVSVGKGKLEKAIHDSTGARGVDLKKAVDIVTEGCVDKKTTKPVLRKVKP